MDMASLEGDSATKRSIPRAMPHAGLMTGFDVFLLASTEQRC
jgi:hypothetical protein